MEYAITIQNRVLEDLNMLLYIPGVLVGAMTPSSGTCTSDGMRTGNVRFWGEPPEGEEVGSLPPLAATLLMTVIQSRQSWLLRACIV